MNLMDEFSLDAFSSIEDATSFYKQEIMSMAIVPADLFPLILYYIVHSPEKSSITTLIKKELEELDHIENSKAAYNRMYFLMDFLSFYLSVFYHHPKLICAFRDKIEESQQHPPPLCYSLNHKARLQRYCSAMTRYHKFIHFRNMQMYLPFADEQEL